MKKANINTLLQHAGQGNFDVDTGLAPVALPSMRTSTVRFKNMDAHDKAQEGKAKGERSPTYGRVGLETHAALESIICELEGGSRAFLAPSGMAAISMAVMSFLSNGDHALVIDCVYAPVRNLQDKILARMGISMDFTAPDIASLEAALKPETKILYLESPGSLLMEMLDLPALAQWAHQHGLVVLADNTWGSGYAYAPLGLGADVSIVAVTKYVGGHSDLMLGAAVARGEKAISRLNETHYALGSTVSADDAWLAIRGSRTLGLRMKACADNARQVYNWLDEQDWVSRIFTPAWPSDPGHELWQRDAKGANGLFAVATNLTEPQARKFIDSLKYFGIGYSWGGYESLITIVSKNAIAQHSYGQSLDLSGTVLRLHVGLEDPSDLIEDLANAFQQIV